MTEARALQDGLRTLLNAVIGFSDALLHAADNSTGAQAAAFAARINEAGRQLLINIILDVVRIDVPDGDRRRSGPTRDDCSRWSTTYCPTPSGSLRGDTVSVGASLAAHGRLLLVVRRTGIGIAEEDMEPAFDITQLDSTLARRFQGAGLGLYVSRALVAGHGDAL